ncbi:MAG: helix-turn-helix domain-containing protein [Alphaproteobacteria bacterium]|nr:MAG: helix-turn-helix domain-containing protein [Alphaproteobacteria bacterium]
MTQAELARALGVRLATLRRWEEDRAEPRANRLQMMAGLLGVSISWLLSGEGKGPSEAGGDELGLARVLAELRALRGAQAVFAERLARLEERIAELVGEEPGAPAAPEAGGER